MGFEQMYHEGEYLDGQVPESTDPSEVEFVGVDTSNRKGMNKLSRSILSSKCLISRSTSKPRSSANKTFVR